MLKGVGLCFLYNGFDILLYQYNIRLVCIEDSETGIIRYVDYNDSNKITSYTPVNYILDYALFCSYMGVDKFDASVRVVIHMRFSDDFREGFLYFVVDLLSLTYSGIADYRRCNKLYINSVSKLNWSGSSVTFKLKVPNRLILYLINLRSYKDFSTITSIFSEYFGLKMLINDNFIPIKVNNYAW